MQISNPKINNPIDPILKDKHPKIHFTVLNKPPITQTPKLTRYIHLELGSMIGRNRSSPNIGSLVWVAPISKADIAGPIERCDFHPISARPGHALRACPAHAHGCVAPPHAFRSRATSGLALARSSIRGRRDGASGSVSYDHACCLQSATALQSLGRPTNPTPTQPLPPIHLSTHLLPSNHPGT